jgi:molecular chaperone IbpA
MEDVVMRSLDFAPLSRMTIGFDHLFDALEHALEAPDADGDHPPYDILRTGEDSYRIDLAVAGFAADQLSITAQQDVLIVSGRNRAGNRHAFLYQGIQAGAFERRFNLADYIKVTGASLNDGILSIDLVRQVPEEKQPRKIPIEAARP